MLSGCRAGRPPSFRFFLAVPTVIRGGRHYDFWKKPRAVDAGDAGLFAAGSITAFISAFLCVRWLLRYIATHDFTPFAWYRIAFGVAVARHRLHRARQLVFGLTLLPGPG